MNDASGAAQRSCDIPDACPHLVKASTGKRVEPKSPSSLAAAENLKGRRERLPVVALP
jgi:hypothetical protein